ncbi:MAG: ATP-binding protein [Bacillus sp. (in: Bacteria)]|nr:ATP-binding protein [Bacillus sp. (in: firmicutes)]MCM1426675.1 ATP-binding protein [Eubacterium sp.]
MFKFLEDHYAKKQVNLILAEGIFDFVLYINIRQGTYIRKYEKRNLPYSLQKEGRYEDLLQSLQSGLYVGREEFSENMKLSHIIGKLSLLGKYAVQCHILIKGHIYNKRIFFFREDSGKNIIAVGEDVTDAMQGRFQEDITAYLTHEIKTSLNSLCGNLHILQTDRETFGENRYLENAVFSADYLQRLVNSALHISAIENKKSVMKLETVTMEELADCPRRMFEKEAAKKNIRLQFLPEKPVYQYLYLYKDVIWQILINLISNAIKYTDSGGSVTCRMAQTYLEEKRVRLTLEVTDTGIGMEQAFLPAAWESYTRERREKAAQGSGLGLTITKRLVEFLQGEIHIDSQVGAGTKVSVNLEADADDALYDFAASYASRAPKIRSDEIITIKRALVAEDEESNMAVLCQYLYELGVAADISHNGREVIDIFKRSEENYYDVILLDIHMPKISGMEAVRTIRNMDRKDSGLPIIAVTADGEAVSAEISGCLLKPYNLEDIRHILLQYQKC